ncbi:MAG: aromatic ring-hydroxylating dioxygenase subunit alpha [Burkholderiaceae bacterium]|nr:aromatic ring-hydroxylating dioxygenase subunit alpha [Burkholderiaceae bacterium]
MFIRNAWYPVGHSRDIRHQILARQICGEKLIMYRTSLGQPVVMQDRCCHRLLPLSKGTLAGDNVVCGYHGLEYAPTGQCVRIPCQTDVASSMRVKSYPAVDRHRLTWVWMGEEAAANPADIPDMSWNEDPEWVGDGETMHLKCDYRLLIDNLLDLSHEAYVHKRDEVIATAPAKTTFSDDWVRVERVAGPIPYSPSYGWATYLKRATGYEGPFHRTQDTRFVKPCIVVIHSGAVKDGAKIPNSNPKESAKMVMINCLVPETETTCWHFFTWVRNYLKDDHQLSSESIKALYNVFQEDIDVLETQQATILEHPDLRMMPIATDAGPNRMRKIIAMAVEAEAANG